MTDRMRAELLTRAAESSGPTITITKAELAMLLAEAAPAGGLREALERIERAWRSLGREKVEIGVPDSTVIGLLLNGMDAILDSERAALAASPSAAPLDVERLARAAHDAWPAPGCTASVHDHNWGPDSLYGAFALRQAAAYSAQGEKP